MIEVLIIAVKIIVSLGAICACVNSYMTLRDEFHNEGNFTAPQAGFVIDTTLCIALLGFIWIW